MPVWFATKGLKGPVPNRRSMVDVGYVSALYSTYDRSRLLSRGISAVSGLAALVGVNYSAAAQDFQPIAYRDTNLASYGVPSVDGRSPFKKVRMDLTDKIPGHETNVAIYDSPAGSIGIFAIDGKPFFVGYDPDKKAPLDKAYIDDNGDGNFAAYDPKAKIEVPAWVLK